MEICRQMAKALDISDSEKITRLHQILNDAGSFAHIAAYVKREGVLMGSKRAALKSLEALLRQIVNVMDELDWQSNENIGAGYAKDEPIFIASADRISSKFYGQLHRDVAQPGGGKRRVAAELEHPQPMPRERARASSRSKSSHRP
jgi:hypothetical protein